MNSAQRTPQRPAIPPVAWFAMAMWVGCLWGEAVSWAVYAQASLRVGVLGGPVVITLAVSARRLPRWRAAIALVIAGLLAGALVSTAQGWSWHRAVSLALDCGAREWTGYVEADPVPGRFGSTVRIRITGGPLDRRRVRVFWPAGTAVPELGRTVRFSAVLEPPSPDEVWSRRTARSGVCAAGSAWRAEIGRWRPGITGRLFAWRARVLEHMHSIRGSGGDLLEGIVLGDRRRLADTATDEDFRVLGLTHLVAVSGSHLALACSAVALVGGALGVRRRPLLLGTLAAGAAYAVVTGLAYSAVRSLVMLVVATAGALLGRRGNGLASLSSAVIVLLAFEPWSVFDIGLQLSVLAVGGLLLFGGLATLWAQAGLPRAVHGIAGPIALTCVAQLLTFPVIASAFGMVSLMAPVANGYAGPLVSVALCTGLAGSVIVEALPGVGTVLLSLSASVLAFSAWVARWMASLPGAAIAVGEGGAVLAVAGAVLLWLRWPLPRGARGARRAVAGAACATLLIALGPGSPRSASVTVLDVGQGDAILVRDGSRVMLVDCGPDDVSLHRALARHSIRRVDVLVLTHAHDDHTGGMGGLAQVAEVGWVGIPGVASDAFGGMRGCSIGDADVRELAAGDRWRIGSTIVRVLWPPTEAAGDFGTNDTSVVLQVSRGGFDALLGGDAEAEALSGIADAGMLGPVEVLKVPHHGSDNGLTADALTCLRPHDALISVGDGNDFGHPCASTLAMLEDAACRVWRTDYSGDLTVRIGRSGYTIGVAHRGTRVSLRARMDRSQRDCDVTFGSDGGTLSEALDGGQGSGGPQAGLPHLWRGRPVARARPPPPTDADR